MDLRRLAQKLRMNSMKLSTRSTRLRHWRYYVKFCEMYKLSPVPFDVHQASIYVSFLALYMKCSSIQTYYQAVRLGHRVLGIEAPSPSHALLRPIFLGLLNTSGVSTSKDPLQPEDLLKISKVVNLDLELEVLVCVAILTMFRALLRISHIVRSDHTLRHKDLEPHLRLGCDCEDSFCKKYAL